MKLTSQNTHFDGHLPDNRVPVTIQSTQQLFGILSDSIYSNKILTYMTKNKILSILKSILNKHITCF